jgi:hypothetical protein
MKGINIAVATLLLLVSMQLCKSDVPTGLSAIDATTDVSVKTTSENQTSEVYSKINKLHYLQRRLLQNTSVEALETTHSCTDANCSYRGRCNDMQTYCICNDGYITFGVTDKQCNYKQKETLIAFLLEFFLGVPGGAGYFYLGQTYMGVGQLLLFWVGLIPLCLLTCCLVAGSEGGAVAGMCCAYLYIFLWGIATSGWWIAALVTIGTGKITDGHGAPIKMW